MPTLAIDTFSEERFGIVTGSRCSPLVPKQSAKKGMISLAQELAQEKYFKFYDEHSTWQTEHGKMAETFGLIYYQEHFDGDMQPGQWHKKGNYGGSTDAENEILQVGADIKSPVSLDGWLDFLYHGLDNHKAYYDQAQLYMKLTGFKEWHICAFLMETAFMDNNGLRYPVPNDKRMIVIKVLPDVEWNKKFDKNLPIVIGMRDKYLEQLKKHFG